VTESSLAGALLPNRRSFAAVREKGAADAADQEMTELRSAVLLSPALTEIDRLPLLQLYDVKREQLQTQFAPKRKAGETANLLTSLSQRVATERRLGSDVAPLLDAARSAVSEALAGSRQFSADTESSGREMATTFGSLLESQRARLSEATVKQLAATARAYVTASFKGQQAVHKTIF
jgi:hypothetical protein